MIGTRKNEFQIGQNKNRFAETENLDDIDFLITITEMIQQRATSIAIRTKIVKAESIIAYNSSNEEA